MSHQQYILHITGVLTQSQIRSSTSKDVYNRSPFGFEGQSSIFNPRITQLVLRVRVYPHLYYQEGNRRADSVLVVRSMSAAGAAEFSVERRTDNCVRFAVPVLFNMLAFLNRLPHEKFSKRPVNRRGWIGAGFRGRDEGITVVLCSSGELDTSVSCEPRISLLW